MQNQPKFVPQRSTTFFADGRSVRPQVAHTVARGQLDEDSFFYTGLIDGKEADLMPFPVSMQVLARGQERFNIYCTPCHSRVGNGAGMIVQRGYKPAGNFHSARILAEPLGHYFYVMTNGYGAMPDYSAQLTPADRWSVAAYIRALQISQNARESEVPSGVQVQNLKDIAEQEGLARLLCSAVVAARDRGLRPTARRQPGNAGNGAGDRRQPGAGDEPARRRRGHQWQRSEAEGLETGNQVKHMAHEHHANSLPAELNAPLLLNQWRRRAMVVGAIFAVLSIVLAVLAATVDHDGINHLLRSYLLGYIICWGFTVGGLALLMVQYLSGGKWGLLVRRPLEAMSRCLPFVMVLFLPIGFFMKTLYLWAKYSNPGEALRQHLITHDQAHAIAFKHPMLSIPSVWIQTAVLLRDLVYLHVPA